MYTIGTSAIKYIAQQLANQTPPVTTGDFNTRLACFVGTTAEMAQAVAYDRTAFLVVNGPPNAPGDAQLYLGSNGTWSASPIATVPQALVLTYIIPASGWNEVIFTLHRALQAQVDATNSGSNALPKIPGLPVVTETGNFYMYDETLGVFRLIASQQAASVPLGTIIYWPEILGTPPQGYLQCGSTTTGPVEVPINSYQALYSIYGTKFGTASQIGYFRLPIHDNGICKAEA